MTATDIHVGGLSTREAWEKGGAQGLHAVIEQNQRAVENDNIFRLKDLPAYVPPKPMRIGMATLDDHYRIREGDFTVVTGIPSHGKSTFLNEVAGRMALTHGWTTCFASFEQMPQVDHRRALRTFYNRKLEVHQSEEEKDAADRWINRFFSFIVPREEDDVTLDWTLDCVAASVIRHKAKLVVIDPWNEMDHIRPRDMSLTEYTGYAIKAFRRLARVHKVHVIVCAHPAKQRKNEDGSYTIPTLYDISDSAHWYNKADCGIIVHRKDDATTIIRVAKSRYHDEIGTPGDVEAHLNREIGRYEIIEPEMRRFEP